MKTYTDNNYKSENIADVIIKFLNVSKIFEKCMFRQISNYTWKITYQSICGFRKGYGLQNCLFQMLDKWKHTLGNEKLFGLFLTDLFKAFDCLSPELLITKLHTYGISMEGSVEVIMTVEFSVRVK